MARKIAIVAAAVLALYGGLGSLLLAIFPAPLRPTDYLVAGSLCTLVSLWLVFRLIAKGWLSGDK